MCVQCILKKSCLIWFFSLVSISRSKILRQTKVNYVTYLTALFDKSGTNYPLTAYLLRNVKCPLLMFCCYCIQEIIRPRFVRPFHPRCQGANIRMGEFLCLKLFFIHNFVWANSGHSETVCK